MKTRLKPIFFKQELLARGNFILLAMTLLMGGVIILSDGYFDTQMGAQIIVDTYSFMVDIFLIYFGVVSLGKEFQYRTINMIRTSKLSGLEVIIRKLLNGVVLSVVLATVLLGELAIYKYCYHHPEVDLEHYVQFIYSNFILYSIFIYIIASIIVLFVKNILGSFLTVYFGLTVLKFLVVYLENFDNFAKDISKYVPFEYARMKITHGVSYTNHEFLVLLVWSLGLLAILPFVYKKKAFV